MLDNIDLQGLLETTQDFYRTFVLEPVVVIVELLERLPNPGAESIYWLYVFVTVLTIILAPLLILVYGSLGGAQNDVDSFIIKHRFPALREYLKSVILLFVITLLWQTPSNTIKLLISPIILYHLISLISYILGLSQWITQKDTIRKRHLSTSNLIAHGNDPYHYATIKWYWQQFFGNSERMTQRGFDVRGWFDSMSPNKQLELFFGHVEALVEQKEWDMASSLLESFIEYISPEHMLHIYNSGSFDTLLELYGETSNPDHIPEVFSSILQTSIKECIVQTKSESGVTPIQLLDSVLPLSEYSGLDTEEIIELVFSIFSDQYEDSLDKIHSGYQITLSNLISEDEIPHMLLRTYMKFVHNTIHTFVHQAHPPTHHYHVINVTHAIFGNIDYTFWNYILLYTLYPHKTDDTLKEVALLSTSCILSQNALVFSLFPEDHGQQSSDNQKEFEQTLQICITYLEKGFEHIDADLYKLKEFLDAGNEQTYEYIESLRVFELFSSVLEEIEEIKDIEQEIDQESEEDSTVENNNESEEDQDTEDDSSDS